MTKKPDTMKTMPLADGYNAEMREDGSIAIFHDAGGLHMADPSEIAMVHEIRRLRTEIESAKKEAT